MQELPRKSIKNDVENYIWWEKYRPKTMSDVILTPTLRKQFSSYIKDKRLPHLFFYSTSPGTGKTTTAFCLCKDLGLTYIKINASKDATIDTIKDQIVNFARNMSFDSSKKVIILDEVDGVRSTGFFDAMRPVMEDFSHNCTFIFTANRFTKIPDAIQSRLTNIEFKLDKEDKVDYAIGILNRCEYILKTEDVKYDQAILKKIIKKFFPDFRSILSSIQLNREFLCDPTLENRLTGLDATKVLDALKVKNMAKVREIIQNDITIIDSIYTQVYDKLRKYFEPSTIPQAILTIDEYMCDHDRAIDKEIHCMAFLIALYDCTKFKEISETSSEERNRKDK